MRASAFLLAFGAVPVVAATPPAPITIGTSYRLPSAALGGERVVNVVLPAGYAAHPERRYPVLYLIDGGVDQDLLNIAALVGNGGQWGRSGEAILVGVATVDRRRELVGPTRDPALLAKYPTAGESARFRTFIRDTVKPWVARSFRSNGRSAVIGESLAGLFIVETYLREPGLFDAYAAIDPSLWWDGAALAKGARPALGAAQRGHPLYLALAKEELAEPTGSPALLAALGGAGVPLCYAPRPDLGHATIYQQLAPQALTNVLPPAEPAPAEYGFAVTCAANPYSSR
ncbi:MULTISPECIES: alpha/beta hydrolase [Sphingomonas]|uniref:alpha/beta hydrolase n=1 Tax=Sphingomonas TaxID=13687 RepID=UPI000DEF805C|nr:MULTISPECIES: alpha/beta hydrolase-fold protein [Sphingomonas]